MFCSPLLSEPRTRIPGALRNWLGARLQGPPRGLRRARRKICVYALGRIGDFILASSTLRLVVREFGADECQVVVNPAVLPLATRELPGVTLVPVRSEASSLVREILPRWWRDRPRLAPARFERRIVLVHQRSFHDEIASTWIDADEDFRLLPSTYPHPSPDDQCTELHAHRKLVTRVLGREVAWEEILPRFTSFTASDDGRLLVYPLSLDASRHVPAERIVAILRGWRAHHDAPIVLGGHPAGSAMLRRYAALAHASGLDGIAVETPDGVVDFITHLAGAGAILSADSGAGHVGTALDKPTVVLTSPGWHGLCQPWHRSARQKTFPMETADAATIAAALPAI